MVALVTNGANRTPIAIHRTYLARDGGGKAPVDPQTMMFGPCRGGAVRLAEPGKVLMVGEGIETCLAAMQATGHPVWAALSTSGLRSLELPKDMHDVVVLADGDEAGEAAARDSALRWKREGRRVRIARPPQGLDFNDMLPGRAPRTEERAMNKETEIENGGTRRRGDQRRFRREPDRQRNWCSRGHSRSAGWSVREVRRRSGRRIHPGSP